MSWRTHATVVAARNIGRMLGVNKAFASLRSGGGYELSYDECFSKQLRPGDCVWDVGANIGHYTAQFSQAVGPQGQVIAFEPSPHNQIRLTERCSELTNVAILGIGLADQDGSLPFDQGEDDIGATSHISAHASATSLLVPVRTGLGVIAEGLAPLPDAIKIDVEGFELEVLQGCGAVLADPALHIIGIEMHFAILSSRGLDRAPAEIEKLLRRSGFRLTWPDSSHLIATR